MVGLWWLGAGRLCFEVKIVRVRAEMLDIFIVLDFVRLRFLSLVFLISYSVFIYRLRYIRRAENRSRLMGVIVVFVFSIGALIMFPSLLGLVIG